MKDLWIDANVLLRLVTRDPPGMAARSLALAKKAERGLVHLHLSPAVLVEVAWVLSSFYGYPKTRIGETLLPLLNAQGLEVEQKDVVMGALALMARCNVDFVDAYLAEMARTSGHAVCSFDRDFDRLGVACVRPG